MGLYTFRKNNISGEDELIKLDKDFNFKDLLSNTVSLYYQKKKSNYITILDCVFFLCIIFAISEAFLLKISSTNLFISSFLSLISKISFAYITGYIFYNIVTRKTDTERKKIIYAVICGNIDRIVENSEIVKKSLSKLEFKDHESVFLEECKKVDLNKNIEPSNLKIKEMIIIYGLTSTNKIIEKIYSFMPYLDGALIHTIGQIENSYFMKRIHFIKNEEVKTLDDYECNAILQFLKLNDELKKINEILKNKYLKNYSK